MEILNARQIEQKVNRLAIEILENNFEEPEIVLAGINNNGMRFATILHNQLATQTNIPLKLTRIRLNPANPVGSPIEFGLPLSEIDGKMVLVIDDVANTGRTLFYATKPLMEALPAKVETAVLVERHHKSFPILVNYVGMSLATTLMETIEVNLRDGATFAARLV